SARSDLHLGVLDLPEQFHQLQAGLRGRTFDHPDADHPRALLHPGRPLPPEPFRMTAVAEGAEQIVTTEHVAHAAGQSRPVRYLVAAACVFVIAVMLAPIVLSVLASIKPAAEAREAPPSYL